MDPSMMQAAPLGQHENVAEEGDETNGSAHPSLQLFAASHDCTIGSISATTVGRDLHVNINECHGPHQPGHGSRKEATWYQRDTLLKHLRAPSFHAVYASALEQRMDETGTWFLELPEFHGFMSCKGATMWCTGMPGAGKTILGSVAVERLSEATKGSPHTALAFAFIRYSERYSWREVLTSHLVQLIEKNDLACGAFWPYYSPSAARATSELIVPESDLEAVLCDIASKLEKLYVVIDGLDEAVDEVKDRLLETLVPSGVNLLILSRPLDPYTDHAPKARFVSIQAKTKDIELYVRGEVQRSSRLRSIFKGKPEKITELCEKINKQSDGMFLVAKLQMGAITRSSRSIASLFHNLEALPAGVNAMYDHTLGRIRESEDASIAFRTLAWIKCTHPGQLEPASLQHALSFNMATRSFDPDDVTPVPLISSACQGLVVVEGRRFAKVRFIHYTTYEYLEAVALDGLPNPHLLLALTCLTCMEDNRDWLLGLPRGYARGKRGFDEPSQQVLHEKPLLSYSHCRWFEHVRSSRPEDPVYPSICSYLSKHDEYPVFGCNGGWPAMEIVSGTHIIAIHNLTDIFDAQSAKGLLPSPISKPRGFTPFHLAAANGSFEVFQQLLFSYSGANLKDKNGDMALHLAVEGDQTSFVQRLHALVSSPQGDNSPRLERVNFDVNAQGRNGWTPLMITGHRGNMALAQLFSSCEGVDFNVRDNFGRSTLQHLMNSHSVATQRQWDALLRTLCSLPHVEVDTCDDGGDNLFMYACRAGLEETVKYLLASRHGGDLSIVHQTNGRRETPLMRLCRTIGFIHDGFEPIRLSFMAVLELLVANGSDLHARDVDGRTPFLWLLGGFDEMPLEYDACFDGHEANTNNFRPTLMGYFLTLDPTLLDQRDDRGRTALMIAAQTHDVASTGWILTQRGNSIDYVNKKDRDGMTALLHACQRGNPGVVAALLASSCVDIHHRCSRGFTAIDWLFRAPHPGNAYNVLELLMSREEWSPSLIRKVLLRAFQHKLSYPSSDDMRSQGFPGLWSLTSGSFVWDLDERDTVLLLVLTASLRPCRIPVALVLRSLSLLSAQDLEPGGFKDGCFRGEDYDQWRDDWGHDDLVPVLG